MVYLVQFESAFATKEEAVAFANSVEQIKTNCIYDSRVAVDPVFMLGRKLQVWESTHDEAAPKPCSLILAVDFNAPKETHLVDSKVP
jgi:hypothetical protein